MKLQQVNPNYVCQLWDIIEPMLNKGIQQDGEYSIDQLKGMLATGERTLLVADKDGEIKGACAVSIALHPNKSVCWIMSLGGSDGVLFLAKELEKWAKSQGCTDIKGSTTRGLSNVLKSRCNYDNSRVIVRKKL